MACRVDDKYPPEEQPPLVDPQSPYEASTEAKKPDYDFVEEPSQDFFCPVTLELLTDPHLTMCCGNHLSQEAANRLKRDGKPCPMCKDPQLNTVPNKHYKRKVNEIKVCCPHKKSGCEWVGGVNEVKQHSDSCPKRPWQCQYCEFESTFNIGVNEHLPVCTKYPLECPNSCEVGSMPRCDLEAHLMVCPLQPVKCEYAEVGCDVKVPRRDLGRHMEEGQQQHLLSATLLNLRLTRENTEEKNSLLRMIEEKDEENKALHAQLRKEKEAIAKEVKVQDEKIKEKEEAIADLQKQLKQAHEMAQQNAKETMAEKLKAKVEYERELAMRNQQIKEKDKKNKEKEMEIKEKDKKISDLRKQLKQMRNLAEHNTTEKDKEIAKQNHQLEIKEAEHKTELAVRDQWIKEKDKTIADLQKQLKQVQDGLEAKVTDLQQQVVKYGEDTEEHLKQQDSHVECVSLRFRHLQGFSVLDFTLVEFKKCQAQGGDGDWYSEPFYSHPGGYKFQLNVETNGIGDDHGVYMTLLFKLLEGDHDDKLPWPVSITAHVQLLNQLGDHNHHEKTSTGQWKQSRKVAERLREESTRNTSIFARVQAMMIPSGIYSGGIGKFIKLKDLELKAENNTQYLKNNSLQFRFYFKVNP